jgi:phospholipase/carboxylesterase
MLVTALVLALHGHQDDPSALAQRLAPLTAPGRTLLSPRSAIVLPEGPVWFRTDDAGPVEADLVASLDALDEAIDDATTTRGIGRDQAVIGGFSQGAAVALALALRDGGARAPLGGVFCVSGWLPHAEAVTYDAAALAAGGTRVLVVHGADDDIVPVQQGRSAARYLERHGVAVQYVEQPGGHHLGAGAVSELARWVDHRS